MGFLCFLNYGLGNNFQSTCNFRTTLHFHDTYTGRSHYYSDIEQCEVAQSIVAHGSRGKG